MRSAASVISFSVTTSDPLEVTLALPVRHGVAECLHLQSRRMDIKLDDIVPERTASQFAAVEQIGGLAQTARQARQLRIDVSVPLVNVTTIQLFLDTGHSGDQRGRKRQIRIRVGP